MYSKTVTVQNPSGLHARPASVFVGETKNYKSKITIKKTSSDDEPLNAKSIILLLSMAITAGTEVEITAQGEDEVQAVDALVALIESGLGE